VLGKLILLAVVLVAGSVLAQDRMPLGTNFWSINWHRADDVFATGREQVKGENPWNPEFIRQIEPYEVLRFMDWGKVNSAERTSFDQRKQPDDPNQSPQVAYEWMIDLCNRTGKDMWVCIPHAADASYSRQLAELIHAQLDPELKLYVEYSNETWNGMFGQHRYAIEQGKKLDLPGLHMRAGNNEYYVGWAYHVYAAVRHFAAFDAVFDGDDAGRLIKVLAGQAGNTAVVEHHVALLDDPTVNPDGVEIDAYAIAPYFGHQVDGGADDVFDQLRADLHDRVLPRVARHAEVLDEAGIDLIAYEGGQHLMENAVVANRDPRMYDLYLEYLEAMAEHMDGVFAHYVHVGDNPPRHMWGALSYTGQSPEQAHKYRALVDYANRGTR
jgi:hypothetical protein